MQVRKEVLKVRKRDGSLEEWNEDKLIASVVRSGLDLEASKKLAEAVLDWAIKESERNDVIETNKVRDKLIEELEKDNPLAANTYRTYKKG